MDHPSRRTLLYGTAGLFAVTAGCLDEAGVASSDDGESDDDDVGAGSNDDNDDAGSGGNDDDTDPESAADETDEAYDSTPFSHPDMLTEPDTTLLVSADSAERWLDDREIADETPTEFVDETSFEESALLVLEAEAPRLDYELALETVTVADEDDGDPQLVVEAAVRGESAESDGAGATQVLTVGQLVRATFEDEPVTRASVTIVDSGGEEHNGGLAAGSASESASDAERDDDT